jgi:hypothetical protein
MHLCFPTMHPQMLSEAARKALPGDLRFLDPGVGDPRSKEHFMPEAAPFDRRTARALLADTLRFGESVADARDLKARSLVEQAAALDPEGSAAVRGQVERSLLAGITGGADGGDAKLPALRQGQTLLLLAWSLEERMIELGRIDAGLKQSWERLGQSVAKGDAEVDDEADDDALAMGRELSGMKPVDDAVPAVPWRNLLESFALLAPGAVLCTALPEVALELADSGVATGVAGLVPGAASVYADAAWRLMGLQRLPDERPWLDARLTIAVFKPAGGEE